MAGGDDALRERYYTRDVYVFAGEVRTPQTGEIYHIVYRFPGGDVVWRPGPEPKKLASK